MLLEVRQLSASIGQYRILHDVSFSVPAGQVTVVVGRNGAGKTTTMRTLLGLTEVHGGQILLNGDDLIGLPPYEIVRLGIGYVPEGRGLFTLLTVEENLRVAERRRGSLKARLPMILDLFPPLERLLDRRAGTLSGGEQQMVAIARALISDNRLLLIDEPSTGLAPKIVQGVAQALRRIATDITVILVEQSLEMASWVGDRYVILEDGRSVQEGPMQELLDSPDLQKTYLGVGAGRKVTAGGKA